MQDYAIEQPKAFAHPQKAGAPGLWFETKEAIESESEKVSGQHSAFSFQRFLLLQLSSWLSQSVSCTILHVSLLSSQLSLSAFSFSSFAAYA